MFSSAPKFLSSHFFHHIALTFASIFRGPMFFPTITYFFTSLFRMRIRFASFMKSTMLAVRFDFKILNTIVQFITIDVMNKLRRQKFSPQMQFHNETMFTYFLTPIHDKSITICNPTFSYFASSASPCIRSLFYMFRCLFVTLTWHNNAHFGFHTTRMDGVCKQ